MGSSSSRNNLASDTSDLGVEEESVDTANEAVPVPYLAGERKIAIRWITPILNPRAEEAPQTYSKK